MEPTKNHILVVDDDTRLRELLQRFLRENGYLVSAAKDTIEARNLMKNYRFNLLIVDVMMPKENGFDFLIKLRRENTVPVIMLTALAGIDDRIVGLENGADDYIAKPFDTKELLLRVANILKRVEIKDESNKKLELGLCVFDMQTKELNYKQGGVLHLTAVEQNLLMILGDKSGQIFTREKLAEILGAGQSPRSIDVQIARMRKKIEKDSKNPRYLQTVRGKGYMLLTD